VNAIRSRATERGVALVAVLWVVVLLSMLAAIFGAETRTETDLARNLVENAQAEALADAGVYRAIAMLLDPDETRRPRVDGTPFYSPVARGRVLVSIQDEGGKLDLNIAPDDLLRGLFIAIGVAPGAAAALVNKIRDFTDPDHIRRPNGAEDEDYRAAGLGYDAKDQPFDSVAELEQVLGMTHQLFARLEPLVTVYSGSKGVNPLTASPEVRKTLPSIAAAQKKAMLDGSNAGTSFSNTVAPAGQRLSTSNVAGSALTGPSPGTAGSTQLRAVTIRSEARTSAGGIFRREALVLLSFGPFAIREWRRSWGASPSHAPMAE
jgi:general secretion pathway protein K